MYNLDTSAANKADQTGKFIKETGKYIGKFTKAEDLTAKSGTKGIGFTFESNDGQEVSFSVYTIKSDGDKLSGFNTLNAVMACMKLRSIANPVVSTATKYDFTEKKDVQYQAPLFLDLMNKQIGVIFQSCEYEKQTEGVNNGTYAWKIELQGAFEAATELTASEILSGKTKPELLANMISRLVDRPLKNKGNQATSGQSQARTLADMDDIPF